MNQFADVILKAISDYKLLLRKIYSAREAATKIKGLGLKRMQIREANDIYLFNIAAKIIDNLEQYVNSNSKSHGCYFGAEEFLRYLRDFFADYRIEDGKVIHKIRAASCAVVEAIQIVTLPENKLSQEVFERLSKCINIVAKYGSIEHVAVLNDAIKRNKKIIMCFLHKYGRSLKFEDFFAKL
jgi:hypothetical protein